MPLFTAPAITRDEAKNVPVGDCESVGFANLIGGVSKTLGRIVSEANRYLCLTAPTML